MSHNFSRIPLGVLALGLFFSCAALPPDRIPPGPPPGETAPEPAPPEKQAEAPAAAPPAKEPSGPASPARTRPEQLSRPRRPEQPVFPEKIPEAPAISPVPENILGRGLTAPSRLAAFLRQTNPSAGEFAENLAGFYVEEAAAEGVNHDIAFAQMCLETGFLRFGGLVIPEMNNFCGLGAIGPGQPGEWFPDPRTGVRAHIQHLKAYATTEPLKQALVDPRYRYVRYGSAPSIQGLAGTWAADTQYAEKITGILERLFAFKDEPPPAAELASQTD